MRIAQATVIVFLVTSSLARAQTGTVHVHGHVLAVPAAGTVVAAIDALPGSPAQTRRFTVSGTQLHVGEEFEATLDTGTATLANIQEIAPLATPPAAKLVTNGSSSTITLDAVVFILGVLILGGFLAWIGKRMLMDERH